MSSSMILGRVSASERMAPVQGRQPRERMRTFSVRMVSLGEELEAVVVEGGLGAAGEDGAIFGEVEGDDRDLFGVEVEPDVELGPVGEGEDADGFAFAEAGVVEGPELGALVFGVPLAGGVAEAVDALLGAGLFFVAAGSAEGCVEASGFEGVEEGAGLEEAAAVLGAEVVGVGPAAMASSLRWTMRLAPISLV